MIPPVAKAILLLTKYSAFITKANSNYFIEIVVKKKIVCNSFNFILQSGKIAEQLDFVNHNVRTKLDEIKRRELERLRHLATKVTMLRSRSR